MASYSVVCLSTVFNYNRRKGVLQQFLGQAKKSIRLQVLFSNVDLMKKKTKEVFAWSLSLWY